MKISQKLRKIFSIGSYVLIALLIICIAFIFYFNKSGKVMFIANKTYMWVKTESMEPDIPAQSYILVQRATADTIEIGDVIVFYSDDPILGGALNTHRVVEIVNNGTEFITKGDNNPAVDDTTAKAGKVIGVYKRNLPFLTALGRFFSRPFGITITFILIIGLTVLVYLPDLTAYIRQHSELKAEREKQQKINELIQAEVERLKSENDKNTKE